MSGQLGSAEMHGKYLPNRHWTLEQRFWRFTRDLCYGLREWVAWNHIQCVATLAVLKHQRHSTNQKQIHFFTYKSLIDMEQFQNEGMAEDDEKDRETKIWMRKQWSLSRHGVVTRNIQCSWNCSRLLPLVWVPTLSPNKVFRNWESWFGRTSQPCSPRIATTYRSTREQIPWRNLQGTANRKDSLQLLHYVDDFEWFMSYVMVWVMCPNTVSIGSFPLGLDYYDVVFCRILDII